MYKIYQDNNELTGGDRGARSGVQVVTDGRGGPAGGPRTVDKRTVVFYASAFTGRISGVVGPGTWRSRNRVACG